MGLMKEFRDFAMKGNALDMAVGIIIGAAFNKIVSSLVSDIIMPPLGMLLGRVDFKDLALMLKEAVTTPDGKIITEAVTVKYGLFISNIIDFLIVAFTIFMVIRTINRLSQIRRAVAPRSDVQP